MSIADQITRLTQCREDIYTALSNKGVSGWTDTTNKFANVPDYINAIDTNTAKVTALESALSAMAITSMYDTKSGETVSVTSVPFCQPLLALNENYRALYHPTSVSSATKYMNSSSSNYVAKLWKLKDISYTDLLLGGLTTGDNTIWPISAELGDAMWDAGFYGELDTEIAEEILSVTTATGTLDFGHSSIAGWKAYGRRYSYGSQTQLGRDYVLGIYNPSSSTTFDYASIQAEFNLYVVKAL